MPLEEKAKTNVSAAQSAKMQAERLSQKLGAGFLRRACSAQLGWRLAPLVSSLVRKRAGQLLWMLVPLV